MECLFQQLPLHNAAPTIFQAVMSLKFERPGRFDNLQGRNCVFSSTWFTYRYSYHQITRIGFELLSTTYNLNYKNYITLTDECEIENSFSEYRWDNWFTDVRYEGVGWMHVGISAWGPMHGSSKHRNELSGSVKGEVCG